MNLSTLRFTLSIGALISVGALGGLVIFYGHDLSQTQVVLLTMIASALVAEVKSATSYIFDGTPKEDASPPTVPTTQVAFPAAPAVPLEAPASPTLVRTSP